MHSEDAHKLKVSVNVAQHYLTEINNQIKKINFKISGRTGYSKKLHDDLDQLHRHRNDTIQKLEADKRKLRHMFARNEPFASIFLRVARRVLDNETFKKIEEQSENEIYTHKE